MTERSTTTPWSLHNTMDRETFAQSTAPLHSGQVRPSAPGRGQRERPLPTFLPGELAADRFEIRQLCGQGGMGQIFRAFDREIGTEIALKVIRPDLAHHPHITESFRREIQLAREVTHPNVCRVFDLVIHRRNPIEWGTSSEPTLILTMELLSGSSLAERLRADGPIEPSQALDWARQIADGLDAAHRAGITHRDLKPSNIILETEGSTERAVIADFGLASLSTSVIEPSRTGGGTLGYSAPEQLRGEPPTPAADVYAFGRILFEMVRGSGAESRSDPSVPGLRGSAEHRLWARIVRRCLQVDPSKRLRSAAEIVRAIDRSRSRTREVLSALRRYSVALAIVALTGTSALAVWARFGAPPEASTRYLVAGKPRPSIALAPIRPIGDGDFPTAIVATSEVVESAIGLAIRAAGSLRVVDLSNSRNDLPSNGPNGLDVANFRLTGHLVSLTDQSAELELSITDAATGETRWRGRRQLALDNLRHDIASTVSTLSHHLSSSSVSTQTIERGLDGLPEGEEALEAYGLALLAMEDGEPTQALEAINQAISLEPQAAALSALQAAAWSALGFDRRAAGAFSRAAELSASGPDEHRWWLQAAALELDGQLAGAARLYRRLWELRPDDSRYGLALARVELTGLGVEQAASTLARLRDQPLSDLDRASAFLIERDIPTSSKLTPEIAQAAERAIQAFLNIGSNEMAIQAMMQRILLIDQRDPLGMTEEAHEQISDLNRWLRDRNDPTLIAQAFLLAPSLFGRGRPIDPGIDTARLVNDLEAEQRLQLASRVLSRDAAGMIRDQETRPLALEQAQRALALARTSGSLRAEAEAHRTLGVCHNGEGDSALASDSFAAALAAARETGDQRLIARYLHNAALQTYTVGRLRQAEALWSEAIDMFTLNGLAAGRRIGLLHSASLLGQIGALDEAERRLRLAREGALAAGPSTSSAVIMATERLGNILMLQDREAEARPLLDEALAAWVVVGSDGAADRIRLYLASLDRDAGHRSEAETAIRSVLARRLAAADRYAIRLARLSLVRTLAEQGKVEEAVEVLASPNENLSGLQERLLAFEETIARALTESAQGEHPPAIARLQEAMQKTAADGNILMELTLRLSLARVLDEDDQTLAAEAQVEEVIRRADEFGYRAIARQARQRKASTARREARAPEVL